MTDTPRKYTRRSREQWQSLIVQWQQSDLSAITFCKRHHLSAASFYQWRQRLADTDSHENSSSPLSSADFIDITSLNTSADNAAWHIVLNLGDGLSLTLNRAHAAS